ncbi:fibronectin type III domain-containing protein [Aquimarina longa]|uniref:fibronectin type III domain-containing protein n=1 Tax=Aquimarina longa TaxID=1080221 RepID=UPI000AAB8D87|nr:fibronectin type III domain-containing protein [Aquimarina longa]
MKKLFIYIPVCVLILFSCEEVLFEEDLKDKKTVLIAPAEGTTVEKTSVTFSWEAVDQATGYRLQLAQPSFESASQIVVDTTVTNTNFNITLTKNTYQWRVKAQNSGSATPYAIASFTVVESEDFSARKIVLIAPQDNEVVNKNALNLQWQAITDATIYRVQLLNKNNEVVSDKTTADTSISITFPEGVTQWQVRAENNTQSTLYTKRTLTIDSKNPKQPVATAPANETTQAATKVTFSWTRETVAGTTEFDSIYIYKDQKLTQLAIKNKVTSPSDIDLDASTTYYWFLKAFDQAGNQSEPSTVSRLTIQ